MEFLSECKIYFGNLLYNIPITISEFFHFCFNRDWWKIRLFLFFKYFIISPFHIASPYYRKDESFIYGECPIITMNHILKDLEQSREVTFVDLGSGAGRAAAGAYLYGIKNVVGVDLIPAFIENSRKWAANLKNGSLEFQYSDILKYDFSKGDLFFIAGVTFSDSLISQIADKIAAQKREITVISVSQPLPLANFKVVTKKEYKFSWGKSLIFIQKNGII